MQCLTAAHVPTNVVIVAGESDLEAVRASVRMELSVDAVGLTVPVTRYHTETEPPMTQLATHLPLLRVAIAASQSLIVPSQSN